jgi:hypothetical protein
MYKKYEEDQYDMTDSSYVLYIYILSVWFSFYRWH